MQIIDLMRFLPSPPVSLLQPRTYLTPASPNKMPRASSNYDLGIRISAFAFKDEGYSRAQIFEKMGMKPATEAKERGWIEG